MIDVAAIFDEVFGPGDQGQGSSENRCVRCVGVPEGRKPLKNPDNLNTPAEDKKHTSNQGVSAVDERCARVIVENQDLTSKNTPTHPTHRKIDAPSKAVDLDAFEERAAIIEFDSRPKAEPTVPRAEAERRATADIINLKGANHEGQ